MLTEQRYEIILGLLREKNSVTVTELKECADSSREWDSKMEHLLHILT